MINTNKANRRTDHVNKCNSRAVLGDVVQPLAGQLGWAAISCTIQLNQYIVFNIDMILFFFNYSYHLSYNIDINISHWTESEVIYDYGEQLEN